MPTAGNVDMVADPNLDDEKLLFILEAKLTPADGGVSVREICVVCVSSVSERQNVGLSAPQVHSIQPYTFMTEVLPFPSIGHTQAI